MKIRNGFVSNSSTSSFCVYGGYFEQDEIKDFLLENKLIESFKEDDNDWDELFEIVCKSTGLSYTHDYESNCVYIGKSWKSIGDNETGKQFKDCIKTRLSHFFKKDIQTSTHEGEIMC
jgi:hypothetical protein